MSNKYITPISIDIESEYRYIKDKDFPEPFHEVIIVWSDETGCIFYDIGYIVKDKKGFISSASGNSMDAKTFTSSKIVTR